MHEEDCAWVQWLLKHRKSIQNIFFVKQEGSCLWRFQMCTIIYDSMKCGFRKILPDEYGIRKHGLKIFRARMSYQWTEALAQKKNNLDIHEKIQRQFKWDKVFHIPELTHTHISLSCLRHSVIRSTPISWATSHDKSSDDIFCLWFLSTIRQWKLLADQISCSKYQSPVLSMQKTTPMEKVLLQNMQSHQFSWFDSGYLFCLIL